ncbi:hypothetical protein BC332_10979 [Capsicum chinense]|nr:hypothetical protein BC332_10979 [Capsicum chinense]
MENYIAHVWNSVSKPQVLYYDDNYYVFKFASAVDRDLVMQSGPYTYRNRPMILRNWSLDFEFKLECFSKIPLWFKFPSLPLGHLSKKALSKLASFVGKPLYTDKCTAEIERISYARVFIKVDINHPFRESSTNVINSIHTDAGTKMTDPVDIEENSSPSFPTLWDRRGMCTLSQMQT